MNTLSLDLALVAALSIALKVTALVGIAAIVQVVMARWTSAAIRHLVWMLTIVALLALPLLSLTLPEWPIVTRTVSAPADLPQPGPRVEESPVAHSSTSSLESLAAPAVPTASQYSVADASFQVSMRMLPWRAMLGAYALGTILLLAWFAAQQWRLHRLARQAAHLEDDGWGTLLSECSADMGIARPVRLLQTRECRMPMAFGIRRPAILIPAIAGTWSVDRRRAVMLHELAHVARRDCLAQTLTFAACALYWFHPAAWWVARRLRIERELSCDDRVIAAGTPPREYAGHLLEIAFSIGREPAPALAVTMARPRQLEGRMRALLDATRSRRLPAWRGSAAGAIVAAAVVLPLAAATSRVVAVESARSSKTPAAAIAQPDVLGPALKAVEWPAIASARRLVYDAASAIGISQDKLPGTWEIRPANTDGTVHLRISEFNSNFGSNIRIDQLEGLTLAQLTGAGGPVQFRLRRDAGTFTFEGVVRSGVGGGTFSFAPDPNFPAELAKRGFSRPTALEQYKLARNDTGYAFVDELNAQRYDKPQTSDLIRAGDHGVSLTYLREMGALGYRLGTLSPLIELRDHGVTPGYIRDLSAQGHKGLSADDLRRARDHGVTPDYVQAMRDNGHDSLTIDQLITARDHGVNADYVRQMRQLGYAVSIRELIAARDHGVDPGYARDLASLGYSGLSLESLRNMRDHGVDPKYVRELKALGYDSLSVGDLITLRDHGLTADRIRAANERAKSRLPVELLKQLAR